jgi:peptidoglycan/xylan/chitin deacetylase (PgdA/CDA1 family)
MYREKPYTGEDLPEKHLCLTYDDGPGKDTLEIATFLNSQGVQATFFVVGKYGIEYDNILEQVASLGHLIANHTFEHPDLPYYLSKGGDVQNQILRTNAVIKKYNKNKTIFLRSPFGKWSKEVANDLNSNLLTALNHIGPIDWDIAGIDCYYWRKGISVEETVDKYISDIEEKKRGIVVMHDEIADMEFVQTKNQTLALTKQLIPILKSKGYKFVRLDEITSIKEDMARPLKLTLATGSGKYLRLSDNKNIVVAKEKVTSNFEFGITDLGLGQFAFLSPNNLFFSYECGTESIIQAGKVEIGDKEKFALIPINTNKFLIRAYNGHFLKINEKGLLAATSEYMRGGEIFTITPVGSKVKNSFSFKRQYKSVKRQLLYVKSKVMQAR